MGDLRETSGKSKEHFRETYGKPTRINDKGNCKGNIKGHRRETLRETERKPQGNQK